MNDGEVLDAMSGTIALLILLCQTHRAKSRHPKQVTQLLERLEQINLEIEAFDASLGDHR